MTPRRHALLARNLIAACGGLEEAEAACRLSRSSLSNAQNVHHDYFLPVDVVADLERYAGDAPYSRAMMDAQDTAAGNGDLVGESIDVNAKTAVLSSHVHHALADGCLTPSERDQLTGIVDGIKNALSRIEADLDSFDAQALGAAL